MIAVYCAEDEKKTVQEFFELFKTPWEFFDPSATYDVVISTNYEMPQSNADLIIIYSSKPVQFDSTQNITTYPLAFTKLSFQGDILFPVYGGLLGIKGFAESLLLSHTGAEVVAVDVVQEKGRVIRVGFDLFREVAFLLSEGQPVENALFPTLECHISIMRNWILSAGIPLVEIPPVPFGYGYFVCLTHDIDFIGIRRHKFDHTMWGFVYRGLFGALYSFLRNRTGLRKLARNWIAVLKLPLVYAGIADDFWGHFDKYANVDNGHGSTFFVIPYKDQAGDIGGMENADHRRRAAPYGISDIVSQVKSLLGFGHEVGVHGIDAWNSVEKGTREFEQVAGITEDTEIGIRMHWLYYDRRSPGILERAGYDYDATLGYNETVGFKNGTTQVFRPFEVRRLLEIPLTIQDTALFYPRRLALTDEEAHRLCQNLLEMAGSYGGVITLSWHDRSLEPERLWGDFYVLLLQEIGNGTAWIGSAQQIVKWFRQRRSITFIESCVTDTKFRLKINANWSISEPQLFCRFYVPARRDDKLSSKKNYQHFDIPLTGEEIIEMSIKTNEAK